ECSLEFVQQRPVVTNVSRRLVVRQAEGGQGTGRFADVPFDRVQAVAAVGDVRGADVLAAGDEIFDPLRQERTERNLKRQSGHVDVVVTSGAGVQVERV